MKEVKVILIFPQLDLETGVFIKNAFNSIGNCKVIETLDPKVLTPDKLTKKVLYVIVKNDIDLVFMSRTATLFSTAKAIRASFSAINRPVLSMYNVDSERNIDCWTRLFPLIDQCDYFFTKSQGSVSKYHAAGYKHTHALQQGIDREVHNIPSNPRVDQWRDVTFLGALDKWHQDACQRIDLIKAIGNQFDLTYGNDVTNKAASALYYSSKINIGSNHFPEVALSISVRDLKIMGSSGFLLTNRVKDMGTLFKEGVHCTYYDDIPDCLEKIKYYLEHDREREKIAAAGYKEVHAKHTYRDRMIQVLKTCGLM